MLLVTFDLGAGHTLCDSGIYFAYRVRPVVFWFKHMLLTTLFGIFDYRRVMCEV